MPLLHQPRAAMTAAGGVADVSPAAYTRPGDSVVSAAVPSNGRVPAGAAMNMGISTDDPASP
ncbi:hypothetical protein [Streptomyces sp. NPDC091649]|uniref:hypothetical protein n=1 Tax=Streptomyces sp. NPDC091649 TaxID=3366004 RepID=UPI0037F9083D